MATRNSTRTTSATRNQLQDASVVIDEPASRSFLADCNGSSAWCAANSDFREINDLAVDALVALKANDLENVRAMLDAIADRSDSAGDEADNFSLIGFGTRH